MTEGFVPWVRVFRSPWHDHGVTDRELLRVLNDVGFTVLGQLTALTKLTTVHPDHDGSYACVMLDPTRESPHIPIEKRVMAAVLFGPRAAYNHLGGAAANADRFDRRGDCASTTYHAGIVTGGCGLGEHHNRVLASMITRRFARNTLVAQAIAASQRVAVSPVINPTAALSYETDEGYSHIRSLPHISDLPRLPGELVQ